MKKYIFLKQATLIGLTILLAALVLVSGCTGGKSSVQQAIDSAELLNTQALADEAAKAWRARDWSASELYYSKLLERADVAKDQLPMIYNRLGLSALHGEHYRTALDALKMQANIDTSVVGDPEWETAYLETLARLNRNDSIRDHLRWLTEKQELPWTARIAAADWALNYSMEHEDYETGLAIQAGFHAAAPDDAAKAGMEQVFLNKLDELSRSELKDVSATVTQSNSWNFPYALVAFEHAKREATNKKAWVSAWGTMRTIADNAHLVNRELLAEVIAQYEEKYGVPRIGLALALPMTGRFGNVGMRIVRGAGVAQWNLARQGVDVDVRVINTAVRGWEQRLNELPTYYTIVGGPLLVDNFKLIAAGEHGKRMLDQRAYFTFLPSLGDAQEGKDAWRFFTGRKDEVRNLVRLAVNELGISNFAVLYPREKFGRAMAKTFYEEAQPLGGRIRGMESYPPDDLPNWGKSIARLLKVPDDFSDNKEAPLPMPDFGAVFMPDGWKQAENLIPNFFFYEGEQLLFLGPGQWSRALDRDTDIEEQYYRLAVCPGAWWEQSPGALALQDALIAEGLDKADFWVALGFDFVRFSGNLGVLPDKLDPEALNDRIVDAAKMQFSMAPLVWDENGQASQNLFLFSPSGNGKVVADPAVLAARVEKASARRNKRNQAYQERLDAEMAAANGTLEVEAPPLP